MVNLHTAEWDIKAIGKVIGTYRHEPIFESVDVSRWNMQHCRRVHWIVPPQPIRVTGGGAVRIQRREDNVLVAKARELLGQQQDDNAERATAAHYRANHGIARHHAFFRLKRLLKCLFRPHVCCL